MQINVINVNNNVQVQNNGQQGGGNNNVTVETNVVAANVQDIVEISGQQPQQQQTAANRFQPDRARMREIIAEGERNVENFRRMVTPAKYAALRSSALITPNGSGITAAPLMSFFSCALSKARNKFALSLRYCSHDP